MSIVSRLGRSLGIEAGEGRIFSWGASTLFLIGWASVSLTNVSETFFLKRVGVDHLPVVFLVNAVLLVGTTYGVSRLAVRTAGRFLLAATFAALAGVVLLLWLLVLAHVRAVFVLLVIASKQLDAVALIVFWTVIGGLLHGRQAKRLYAPMIAGGTMGRIVGSFASASIGSALGIPTLLPAAATALALAGVLVVRVHAAAPAHVARLSQRRSPAAAPLLPDTLASLWRQSRLFQLLVLSALFAGTLGPMLYFQFSYIVDFATRGSNAEMRLLDVYAKLRGFINVGVLLMQLIGTPRLFRQIGVPLAATLSPVVYLIGFFGVSTRLDLPSGIGAVGGTNLQDHAIQEPAQRILATLLPERVRAAATSLIEGPVQRTGSALGNILVLCALAVSTPASVGFVALPIAAFWLAISIALWRIYPTLLLEVACTGPMHADVTHSLPELVDAGTARVLLASLVSGDSRRCRAACALVIEAPRARAVATLARAIREGSPANRPLLIDALHDLLERPSDSQRAVPEAARSIESLLTDATALLPAARARLVEVYARLVAPVRRGTSSARILTELLNDRAAAVRLTAVVRLQRAGLADVTTDDLNALLAAGLAGDDASTRHVALAAIRAELLAIDPAGGERSKAGDHWRSLVALVGERLNEPRDLAQVAELLADVAARQGKGATPAMQLLLPHAQDHDPRVRAAVVRSVGHVQAQQHVGWVIERLAADDERESAAAAEALRAFGPAAMNAMLTSLQHGKRGVRDALLPILRDLPVDGATLQGLVDREIGDIYRLVLQRYALMSGTVPEVVLQRLRERTAESLHTTLLLLATMLHEERIAALGRLLARSPDKRRRAVLLEALEALLPPAESARLMPLLESDVSPALALRAARALDCEPPSFQQAFDETLSDEDLLTRELLAVTLEAGTSRRAEGRGSLAVNASTDGGLAVEANSVHHGDADGGRDNGMLNKVEIMLHLRSLDLFARLTTRELSELAGVVHEETFPSGSTIVREGEFGVCLYVVVEGEVRVTREGNFVTRFKPGEFFGEMALFDDEPRFATVTAATELRLLRLEQRDLLQLIDEQPGFAIAMCQTLAGRVRELINRLEGRGGKGETEV